MMAAYLCAWALATEPAALPDPFEHALDLMQSVGDSGYPRGGSLLALVALEEHPDHPRAPMVRLQLSRYQRANGLIFEEEKTLERGLEVHPVRWRPWLELAILDARLQRQDFAALVDAHEGRSEWAAEISDAAHFYGAWGRAATGDNQGAQVLLAKVRGTLQPAANRFASDLARGPSQVRKPAVAGVLSILPGAGHAYAGDPTGAAANGLVTGGLGGAGVYFFTQDEPVLAAVFGILGSASLLAGVGDAMRQAQSFNRVRRLERLDDLTREWWIRGEMTSDADRPLEISLAPPEE